MAATEGEDAGAPGRNAALGEEDDDLRETFIDVHSAVEVGQLAGGELAEEVAGEVGGVVVGVGKGSMAGTASGIGQSGGAPPHRHYIMQEARSYC